MLEAVLVSIYDLTLHAYVLILHTITFVLIYIVHSALIGIKI